MDFALSDRAAVFRADVKAFLAEQVTDEVVGAMHESGTFNDRGLNGALADAGLLAGAVPGYGNRDPVELYILFNELEKAGAPYDGLAVTMLVAGVVHSVGTDFHRTEVLERLITGRHNCCLGYSEPDHGSDVAAITTRAVRDGDGWVIDGRKMWTTMAHESDWVLLLTRTDPDVPKHKGLTMFWIDMKDPAVECRPIHQMSGGREFNEVYFTDLRVKDSQRLGEVGDGWKVALVTLMNERLAVGGSTGPNYREIMKLARELSGIAGPALKEQGFREKLADWYVQSEGLKFTRFRTMTALSRGQTPGPESSIGKIISANQLQELANTAVEMEDQYGILSDPDVAPAEAAFQQSLMWAPGLRIAGGTDEILKNIIAERVLGLPGDVRVDKDVPFKDMPTGR